METNVIKAIINLVSNPIIELKQYSESHNRVNSMGEALEEYVKDLFTGTVNETDNLIRKQKQKKYFSYLGNQNNPPDCMIRGGDAIEIKKIESKGSYLALNSSYPKAKLYSSSEMITNACRNCEIWTEKDIIYIVGVVNENQLSSLCMVYGEDYASSEEVYSRIKSTISEGVTSIEGVQFSETKELGRVNRVDPLGITYLRIRGMWGIENPMSVFSDVYSVDFNKAFNFMALINNEKYAIFSEDTKTLEAMVGNLVGLEIKDVKIKNPDNPAKLKDAKLITFKV